MAWNTTAKLASIPLLLIAATGATATQTDRTEAATSQNGHPTAANLQARNWYQDAKFGVFVHWGLYSELGGVGTPTGAEWVMQNSRIPAKSYERLARFFNPTKFDANEWVSAVKAAGAHYMVVTTKHHDGFAMFRSEASPYNIVDATPFKRDVMKELAAACRKHGVKLFFYFSQLDWHHPDYFPLGRTGHAAGRPAGGDWERYLNYQDAQIRELLTNYGPIGGIWFDGWWDQEDTAMRNRWRLDRTYALIHELQPQALIINNHHQPPFPGEDIQTFERDLPGQNTMGFSHSAPGKLPLEMAETMNGSWGYSLTDTKYKSTPVLIRTLVGAAGRNANFLLNTGPMPNGEIQPENLETFRQIGDWLKTHGESIYDTRGGPVSPRPWGVTTARGKTVYVHILDNPDQRLFVPLQQQVKNARLLIGGRAVTVEPTEGGIDLVGVAKPDDVVDLIVRIELR